MFSLFLFTVSQLFLIVLNASLDGKVNAQH